MATATKKPKKRATVGRKSEGRERHCIFIKPEVFERIEGLIVPGDSNLNSAGKVVESRFLPEITSKEAA